MRRHRRRGGLYYDGDATAVAGAEKFADLSSVAETGGRADYPTSASGQGRTIDDLTPS